MRQNICLNTKILFANNGRCVLVIYLLHGVPVFKVHITSLHAIFTYYICLNSLLVPNLFRNTSLYFLFLLNSILVPTILQLFPFQGKFGRAPIHTCAGKGLLENMRALIHNCNIKRIDLDLTGFIISNLIDIIL